MIRQKPPNAWSCLPTAFAIVFDLPVADIFQLLGHDGSEIVDEWSDLPDPYRRRSFHIQELILIADQLGYAVTPFQGEPTICTEYANAISITRWKPTWPDKIEEIMSISRGVLTGLARNRQPHAVAWDSGILVDPASSHTLVEEFDKECFWRIIKI